MKKRIRLAALVLAASLLLCGCGQQDPQPTQTPESGSKNQTLVVGTLHFDGKFSPFFY